MKNVPATLRILFFILSIVHLIAIAIQSKMGVYFTKPLLLSLICGWFYLKTKNNQSVFRYFLLAGLIFSIGGDTFLMFSKPGAEQFFLLGLGAFMVTHVFYIAAFSKYPSFREGIIWKKRWLLIPFLIYLISFSLFLWKDLPGPFKIPVTVYATVITMMAVSCLNMKGRVGLSTYQHLFTGAALFVISDSIIALREFKFPDANEIPFSFAIMSTYLMGQYLIAKGSILAIKKLQ